MGEKAGNNKLGVSLTSPLKVELEEKPPSATLKLNNRVD